MKIGIIGAMEIETRKLNEKLVQKELKKIAGMKFYVGKLENVTIVLCNCFEGKVNAAMGTQILIDLFQVDFVLNIGVAGAIKKDMTVGSFAIAKECIEFDLDTTALGYSLGYVFGINQVKMKTDPRFTLLLEKIAQKENKIFIGTIATSDRFISDQKTVEMLQQDFDEVVAADMETASICHVCSLNQIPFAAIRAISDQCSNIEYKEFLEQALQNLDKIVYEFILELKKEDKGVLEV